MTYLKKNNATKKAYSEFRQLLVKCIGSDSQADFAIKAKISKEHLNRLLKNDLISRPSKDTLAKIYRASNADDVSMNDLMLSCEYCESDVPVVKRMMYNSVSEYEDDESIVHAVINSFKQMLSKHKIYSNIGGIVVDYKDHYMPFASKFSIYIADSGDAIVFTVDSCLADTSINVGKGEKLMAAQISWESRLNETQVVIKTIEFMLSFVNTDCNGIILTDAIFRPTLVARCHPDIALMKCWKNSIMSSDNMVDLDDIDCILIGDIRNKPLGSSPEEKLLACIFGNPYSDKCIFHDVKYGYGFSYDNNGDKLIDFIKNHKSAFLDIGLSGNEVATEIYEELFDEHNELYHSVSNSDLDMYLSRLYTRDANSFAETICAIIRNELSLKYKNELTSVHPRLYFVNYQVSADEFRSILKPVITIDDEFMCELNAASLGDKFRKEIQKYASELGCVAGDTFCCCDYSQLQSEMAEYVNFVQA